MWVNVQILKGVWNVEVTLPADASPHVPSSHKSLSESLHNRFVVGLGTAGWCNDMRTEAHTCELIAGKFWRWQLYGALTHTFLKCGIVSTAWSFPTSCSRPRAQVVKHVPTANEMVHLPDSNPWWPLRTKVPSVSHTPSQAQQRASFGQACWRCGTQSRHLSDCVVGVYHHCIGHFMTPRKEGTKQSKEITLEDCILLRSRVQSCYHGVWKLLCYEFQKFFWRGKEHCTNASKCGVSWWFKRSIYLLRHPCRGSPPPWARIPTKGYSFLQLNILATSESIVPLISCSLRRFAG